MLKILLINPPFNIKKENYDSSISVGLLSIATYLDSVGIGVEIVDGVRQKNYLDLVKEKIKDSKYACLSVMTMQISRAFEICRLIRKLNPETKIIWGGSHPTFFIKETAIHPLVDIVCYGEGEITTKEIVEGKDLSEINGIAYKKTGEVIVNPHTNNSSDSSAGRHTEHFGVRVNPPRGLHNPAEMPLFNWDLVPKEILHNLYLIPSLTSRGCPHRCTFCINAILKNRWRMRTAEQVLNDLEIIKSKEYFKDKKLRFWDENFFVDIGRAKEIINGMIERNLIIPWETTIRASYVKEGMVDDEFMGKLRKSGCYLLSFGAESGSPHILTKIKKDVTPEEIINSAKICLKHDIIPQYSFMIGLPGETKKDMMMTLLLIDKLIKLSPKVQILGPQAFRPYPGSTLYEECLASGWKEPVSLEEWAHLAENQLSYLTVQNFPWVRHKDFVESMEAYVRFGAHPIKSAMGSSISANKIIKLGFILLCKLRWKLKFFAFPVEFKLAKRFVTK